MGAASYLNVLERYHDNRDSIREFMASMLTGIADSRLQDDESTRCLTSGAL